MLILAGVSINAIVGDNGVLTKAQAASIASRKAAILEELNLELASYNIDSISGLKESTTTMLRKLIDKKLIDTVLVSSGEYVSDISNVIGIPQFDDANKYTGYMDYAVKKEDYSIIISVDDSGIYKAEYGDINISSGGSVASGTTIVTEKAFTNNEGASPEEQGKFVIDNDASVMFVDSISGELSILVTSGVHAKVYIFNNMSLTNTGIQRSAIDIEAGGTLDLYIDEGTTVIVDSGIGTDANRSTEEQAAPGTGGYAGIHVPEGSVFNLSGKGILKAQAGDASDGSDSLLGSFAGSGGGGAGAGIGGNGGAGGWGSSTSLEFDPNGQDGENCGTVNITDTTVFAYGGAGGSSGVMHDDSRETTGSGIGAGGYPGAGIGGGGAGGGRRIP